MASYDELKKNGSNKSRYDSLKEKKNAGFDTLADDYDSLSKRVESALSGWQDADTMSVLGNDINSMTKRLNSLNTYYGGKNENAKNLLDAYTELSGNWKNISDSYAYFKDAESYANYKPQETTSAFNKYAPLTQRADFKDVAAQNLVNDGNYMTTSPNDVIKSYESRKQNKLMDQNSKYGYMSEDEYNVYRFIYNKVGKDSANAYLDDISSELNKRATTETAQNWSKSMSNNVLKSLASAGLNFLGGASSVIGDISNKAAGKDVDAYDYTHFMSNAGAMLRSDVSESINNNVGSFLYDTGMSILDNVMNIALLGGLGEGAILTNMMMLAYSNALRDNMDMGMSENEALIRAIISGGIEGLTEKFSLENLLSAKGIKTFSRFLTETLKQGGIEASEEISSELLNKFVDAVSGALGYTSEYQKDIAELKARGFSDTEIFKELYKQSTMDVALAGLGGFISGGVMGGTTNAIEYGTNTRVGKTVTDLQRENTLREFKDKIENEDVKESLEKDNMSNAEKGYAARVINAEADDKIKKSENIDDLYNAIDNRNNARSIFTSATGVMDKKGKAVDVKGMEFKDGQMFIKTDEGLKPSSDFAFTDSMNNTIEFASNLPDDMAKPFAENFKGGNLAEYIDAFELTYLYGKSGKPITAINTSALTNEQKNAIYLAGTQAKDSYSKNTSKLSARKKSLIKKYGATTNVVTTFDDSIIAYDGIRDSKGLKQKGKIDWNSLTDNQKSNIMVLRAMSDSFGINIKLFDSETTDNNEEKSINGFFDSKTNTIHIDINASNTGGMGGKTNGMITTLSHEITHWCETKSPELYTQLRSIVLDAMSREGIMEGKIQLIKENEGLSEDNAIREIVARACENMLLNSTYAQSILSQMTDENAKTFIDKVKDFIAKLKKIINEMMGRTDSQSLEYKALAKYDELLTSAQIVWDDMLKDAADVTKIVDEGIKNGYFLTGSSESNVQMNEKTYESGGRDELVKYVKGQIKSKNLTKKDGEDLINALDMMYAFAKSLRGEKYVHYTNWATAGIDDLNTLMKDDKGHALFSVITPNGDYKMNIDTSTVCKKRKALNKVLNKLASDGRFNLAMLTDGDINLINEIIKKYDFEIACGLCFVDSKRYRTGEWASSFTFKYNDLVDGLNKANGGKYNVDEFDYLERPDVNHPTDNLLDAADLDLSYLDKVIKEETSSNSITERGRIAKALKENPSLRKHVSASEMIASEGLERMKVNNDPLYSLLFAHEGSAKPKMSQSDTPFQNDVIAKSNWTTGRAKAVGGVRIQSFSDFVASNFFDYMQIFSELEAKRLPAHAYTKELAFAKLFGLTGIKINLSAIPGGRNFDSNWLNDWLEHKYVDGKVASVSLKAGAKDTDYYKLRTAFVGLKIGEDGYPVDKHGKSIFKDRELKTLNLNKEQLARCVYETDHESINLEEAIKLQNQKGYDKNVGVIFVGASDNQIWKMLDDKDIPMIIPYHRSGLSTLVALGRDVLSYKDYTDEQNTRYVSGYDKDGNEIRKKLDTDMKDFDWYADLEKTHDARQSARNYIAWCEDTTLHNGYKFVSKFDAFAGHDNYYKLLEDFRMYDKDGNYAPQENVKLSRSKDIKSDHMADGINLPTNYNKIIKDALEDYEKTESRFDKEVPNIIKEILEKTSFKSYEEHREAYEKKEEKKSKSKKDSSIQNSSKQSSYMQTHGEKLYSIKDEDGLGNGYDGYSMSVNARYAYANGEKPISKWSKNDIISAVNNIDPAKAELLKKVNLKTLKDSVLTKTSWHHTSEYYNKTDFYSIDKEAIDRLSIQEIKRLSVLKETKATGREFRGNIKYLVWVGTRNHPKAIEKELIDVNIEERGAFYIVTDDNGKELLRKKIDSNGTKVVDYETEEKARQQRAEREKIIEDNSTNDAYALYQEMKKEGFSSSMSGNLYRIGRKPSSYDVAIGVETFFKKGEQRLSPNANMGYDVETWDGKQWVKNDHTEYSRKVYSIKQEDLDSYKKALNGAVTDTKYLKAIHDGKMDEADAMVKAYAKSRGYTEEVFHGTTAKKLFNVFQSGHGQYGDGVYFTYSKGIAEDYGKAMKLYVNVEKTAAFDDAYNVLGVNKYESYDAYAVANGFDSFDDMINDYDNDPTNPESNRALIDMLVEKGFDSFEDDGNSGFVIWDIPGFEVKIKSADTITYDDDGNVIPLSRRFDKNNPDIRYSKKEEDNVKIDNRSRYEKSHGITMGININDKSAPFTDMIMSKEKTMETRNSRSLDAYIGKTVAIVRTGKGKATIVGYARIGKPKVYKTADEFDKDFNKHRVDENNPYYFNGTVKYGYPLLNIVKAIEERPVNNRGVVSRNISYSVKETRPEILEYLNRQEKEGNVTHTFKSMALIDGKLYPPMASKDKYPKLDKNGNQRYNKNGVPMYEWKLKNEEVLGEWMRAEENPSIIERFVTDNKTGVTYGKINLKKSNGKNVDDVAYNPYEHSVTDVLNDQFEEAYKRPELVTVECIIPNSELNGDYWAEHAMLPTGKHEWKPGKVSRSLKNTNREVYLTRWIKPLRILSSEEVAMRYKEIFDKENQEITVPYNVVTPEVRANLEKLGVGIQYSWKDVQGNTNLVTDENITEEDIASLRERIRREEYQMLETARVRYRDAMKKEFLISRISTRALRLNNMLKKNSKEAHCPDVLKPALVKVLSALDFDGVVTQEVVMGDLRGHFFSFEKDFSNLALALAEVKNKQQALDDMENYFDVNDEIIEEATEIAKNLEEQINKLGDEKYSIKDIPLATLGQIEEVLSAIAKAIINFDKALASNTNRKISSIANLSMIGLRRRVPRSKEDGEFASLMKGFLGWDNLTPVYAFDRFFKGGEIIFEEIMDGQDKLAFNSRDIIETCKKIFDPKSENEWNSEIRTYTTEKGKTIDITTSQIMSLYCLNKRDSAKQHMYEFTRADGEVIKGQGIVINPVSSKTVWNGIKPTKTEGLVKSDVIDVTEDDVKALTNMLTDKQKEVADALQKYMNTTCSDWGNVVTMKRFGILQFGEANYFPMQVYKGDFKVEAKDKNQASNLFRLLNMGFTKSLNEKANSPLELESIFDVFFAHASDMALYNAMALPVLDAYKWLSYVEKITDDDGNVISKTPLNREMYKIYGKQSIDYIKRFLEDINGINERTTDTEKIANKLISNFKASSVAMNLRVGLMQPTSIFRACNLIDAKYITSAISTKPSVIKESISDMMETGIGLWKNELGFRDTHVSRGIESLALRQNNLSDTIKEKSMILAEIGDKVTWGYLYKACELETKELNPDMEGQELKQAIYDRFRDICYRTQVFDSTLTRSTLMRSSNGLAKFLTAFASEPTLSYSMLSSEVFNFFVDARNKNTNASWKAHGQKILRAFASYMTTAIAVSMVAGIPDVFRADDDEELLIAWVRNFGMNLLSEVSGLLPFARSFESIVIEGYSSSRMDEAIFDSFRQMIKTWNNGKLDYRDFYYAAKVISQGTGYSISNAMREIKSTIHAVKILWNATVGKIYPSLKIN